MGRKLSVGALYEGIAYKIAVADVTRKGMAVFASASTQGNHASYPPDGRLHYTEPGEGLHHFSAQLPPHSEVTFQVFDEMQLSSTGPPAYAQPFEPSTNDFLISGPTAGMGNLFAALVNNNEIKRVTEYVEQLTSNSTHAMVIGTDVTMLVGWAPNSTGFLSHLTQHEG